MLIQEQAGEVEGVTFPKAGSEDAVLSVVVCRINECQLFKFI